MRFISTATCLVLAVLFPAPAQPAEGSLLDSVVAVRVEIREDAPTAEVLGTTRQGPGILIDDRGLVLTIGYLIIESRSVSLVTGDGRRVQADFVGYDHETGFGLVRARERIAGRPMELGNSSQVEVGDELTIAAIPLEGADPVQTVRVVSREEFTGYWEYWLPSAIYVSPPHPAFGGAGLVDAEGKLVGVGSIFTRLRLPGYGTLPANMFVPIDLLKPILTQLRTAGRPIRAQRPWLGISSANAEGQGVLVGRVNSGGPADRAGLQRGDVILRVAGESVSDLADFYKKVWALGDAGVAVPLTLLREGRQLMVIVESADRYDHLKLGPDTT